MDWRSKVNLPGIARLKEVIEENAPVTIVPIGPLTNIALLFYYYPEILQNNWVEKLVIMGGSINKWEFNFANDPAATQFVLDLSIPTVICGYETCMAQKFTREHYNLLKQKNTIRTRLMVKEIKGWLRLNELVIRGKPKGFYPFDTVAIAAVLKPELFKSEKMSVYSTNVDKKKYKKFDFSTKTHQKANSTSDSDSSVFWTKEINSKAFLQLLMDRLY
jgi:inosine-uridine nucleoside N-ribohydrolase